MIIIKDIGKYESLPQIANDIINADIDQLNHHLIQGWDIEKPIELSKYINLSPLDLALIMESFESVKWLIEHNVNLNVKDNPSFLHAVRYCGEEIVRYVVAHGAKVDVVNQVKSEAFSQALYGNRFENLQLIQDLGHTVQKYGGEAFRENLDKENYAVLDFFINHGVDINYNKPDQVYPFRPTPLCVAARYVNLQMCKYLVEHGADVTLAEKEGMRPYSIAVENGDNEMAEYFKSIEPTYFHNIQNKLLELKPYKLPQTLIDFLQSENLCIDLPDSDFKFIEFFSLMDTIPFKIGRQKLLRISKKTGDYEDIILVWNPKPKKIAYYDMEHKELGDMCSFEEFIKSPSSYLEELF